MRHDSIRRVMFIDADTVWARFYTYPNGAFQRSDFIATLPNDGELEYEAGYD